ncbi:MAG: hypothetical protein Q9181_005355, partial [Wetmoreana brouardii]
MARLFSSASFLSRNSRPADPLRSVEPPSPLSRIESPKLPSAAPETALIQRNTTENPRITLASVHDQWTEGLNQYAGFRLHTALTTFKRLLRALRTSTDEASVRTADEDGGPEPMPYQILLPEEVALLYINIALIHAYLGSYYLAATAFEEALLLDEASGIALFGLGIARFYMRELGASKRAFKKCLASFAARDEQRKKYYRNELTYQVWSGQPEVEKRDGIIGGDHASDNVSDLYRELKSALVTDFPDGQWTLEWARVEWDWRIALFERNYVRKGTERPGGGRWGLNGIPAGVIFDLEIGARSSVDRMSRMTDDSSTTKSNETVIATDPLPIKEVKSDSGSLVKKKWAALQHKILRKKSSAATAPSAPVLRSAISSNSMASSVYSNEDSAGLSSSNNSITEMAMADGRCGACYDPWDRKDLTPLTSSSATRYHPIFNPYGEDTDAAQISSFPTMSSQQTNVANANATAAAVPPISTRRSSMLSPTPPPTRASMPGRRRSSRDSKVMVNTMMQNIGSIKEEAEEEDDDEIGDLWLGQHHARGKENPGTPIQKTGSIIEALEDYEHEDSDSDCGDNRHRTAGTPKANFLGNPQYGWHRRPSEGDDSPNLSPLTRRSGYATTANSMQDTTPGPTLPATTYIPPTTTTNPNWGSDSFTTDRISPLSSQMRSAMFPSLSSPHQSRRPSYATTDGWDARANPGNLGCYQQSQTQSSRRPSSTTDFPNSATSEAYDRLNGRHRPVSAITVTPATPPTAATDELVPVMMTDSNRNSLVDSYYYGSHSRNSSYCHSYAGENPHLSYTGGYITDNMPSANDYSAASSNPRYPSSMLMEEEITVQPLRVTKKERMRERTSITGRTCLGEWEWED